MTASVAQRGELTSLERIELRGNWKAIGKAGSQCAREKKA
jgi:ribosome biogenesis GTPase / thiamine phosphate phosphatase